MEWVDKEIDDDLVDDITGEKVKEKIRKQIEELDLSFGKPPFDDKSDTQSFLGDFSGISQKKANWLGSMLFGESQKYIAEEKKGKWLAVVSVE